MLDRHKNVTVSSVLRENLLYLLLSSYIAVCQLQVLYFRKYVFLMDEVYTVCEDWGEGSGLQLWQTDCNEAEPGENNNRYTLG